MTIEANFTRLKDALLKHLPRPLADGPVIISAHRLQVLGEGVSVRDIALMIADLTGEKDFLPEDLPINDLRLYDLDLHWVRSLGSVDLVFSIGWENHNLSLAERFQLKLATVTFRWYAGRLWATGKAQLQIDDYLLTAELELPAQIIRIDLAENPSHAALLAKRGLLSEDHGHAHVVAASLLASVPLRFVSLYAEVADLVQIGPVSLSRALGQVDVAGEGVEAVAAEAEITITMSTSKTVVMAAHAEVDKHGWMVWSSYDATPDSLTLGALYKVATNHHDGAGTLPAVLDKLAITHIDGMVDTHSGTYRLNTKLAWSNDADLRITVQKSSAEQIHLTGQLHLGDVILTLDLEQDTGSFMAGSYEAAGRRGLGLEDLAKALGVDGSLMAGMDVHVSALGIVADDNKKMLMAAAIDAGVDLRKLGDLPILGALLPDSAKIGLTLDPYFVSKGMTVSERAAARKLLPAGTHVPAKPKVGVNIVAELHLGDGKPITKTSETKDASPPATPIAPSKPAHPNANITGLDWHEVNKSLGPLHVRRFGYKYANAKVAAEFDADLSVAGLSLALAGFGAEYDIKKKTLIPHLSGAALEIKRGKVDIGAAFVNLDGDFAGSLTVAVPKFSLHAIGAFKMLDDVPSIFAFGTLDVPLGGPVFFFVEGLAAGIGVHRKLHMPKIENLHAFPLITSAGDVASGTQPPPDPDPMAQLRNLHDYVSPSLGDYFLAVGLKFNSFRLLHCEAVAIVQFGRHFEIDLVGTGSYAVPPDLPSNVPALAHIQVDILARFAPDEGEIEVRANISTTSYVYSPLCHLSGGLVFYAWTKGSHGGDFVLSIGGYSRYFTKKPHYPDAPRMALKFQVTKDIYIKGEAYFALTPSVVMAGGALHVNATIGSARAWGNFSVDFLLGWEPFHYDAHAHIDVGAKWKCFSTTASVDLHIWGPDFSGIATIDWAIFSFDVSFGSARPYVPPISFDKFQSSFLGVDSAQKSKDDILSVAVAAGAHGKIGDMEVISSAALECAISTRIPIVTAYLGSPNSNSTELLLENEKHELATQTFGMPPMGGTPLDGSTLIITAQHSGDGDISSNFNAIVEITGVPAALWLPERHVPKEHLPINAATGLVLKQKEPSVAGRSTPMTFGPSQYKAIPEQSVVYWGPPDVHVQDKATDLPRADLALLGLVTTGLGIVPSPIQEGLG